MNAVKWITLLTPVVGPILTELAKKYATKVPSWLTPILAVLLGAGANLVATNMAGATGDPTAAVLLGLAGIGVREVAVHAKEVVGSDSKK